MRTTGLLWARARSSATLLLTIVVLAAAMTAIIAGTLGYSAATATQAARDSLTTGSPQEAAVLAQTRLADDAAAQSAAADEAIAGVFGEAAVLVQRTVRGEPIGVAGSEARVVPDAGPIYEEAAGAVEVVDGERPGADAVGEGLLQADAAALLGVGVGDTLTLTRDGEYQVTVTGLWRAVDPEDPRWFADPLVSSGLLDPEAGADSDLGPLVLSEPGLLELGGRPFVRFTVLPDADGVAPADLTVLAAGAEELRSTLQDAPGVNTSGITVEGELAPTTARAALNLQTAAALNLIPLTLLLAVSLIALVQIARLLAQTRARETEVMVARGATVGQFTRWSLLESGVVTAVGAVVGTGLALLVVRAFPAGAESADRIVVSGAVVLVVVLTTLTVVAALRARAITRLAQADRSGRLQAAAALGTILLAFAAAAFTLWQLRRYGSPLVPAEEAGGRPRGDLIAGAAPTMLLLAGAVLAMALLGPATRLLEGTLRRARTMTLPLAAAQVSRRLAVYVVPVVLTVLAVGATTLSGFYAGTSAQLRQTQSELALGTDVRVLNSAPAPEVAATATDTPGVDDVASVYPAQITFSGEQVPLLAVPSESIGGAVRTPVGGDAEALRAGLAEPPDDPVIWLPDDATTLELDLQVTVDAVGADGDGRAGPVEVTTVVLGRDVPSSEQRITGEATVPEVPDEPQEQTLTLDLPVSSTRALTGIEVVIPTQEDPYDIDVRVLRIRAGDDVVVDAADPDTAPWQPAPIFAADGLFLVPSEVTGPLGQSVEVPAAQLDETSTLGSVALLLSAPGTVAPEPLEGAPGAAPVEPPEGADALVPIALTRPLATSQDLAEGSRTTVNVAGATVRAEVVAVVDAVPGSSEPNGVLMGLETLDRARVLAGASPPPIAQTWVGTSDPDGVAESLRAAGVGQVQAVGAESVTDVASAVRAVFWVASIGATLLAAAGIGAVGLTLLRERRSEVAVLRALGMPPAPQSSSRAFELIGVAGAAALLGALAGWAASAVTLPSVASSTDTSGQARIGVPLTMEWPFTLLLIGLLLLTLTLVASVVAGRVRGQALDNEYREEVR